MTMLVGAILLVVLPIILVIIYMIANGYSAISWDFLTQPPSQAGKAGGILPAIVGTVCLMLGTILFALPVGVMAGITWLSMHATPALPVHHMAIINLAGVPSIVFGLFGLAVFVLTLNLGMSILAASLTLAAQALAMTITTSREAIVAVPKNTGKVRWPSVFLNGRPSVTLCCHSLVGHSYRCHSRHEPGGG